MITVVGFSIVIVELTALKQKILLDIDNKHMHKVDKVLF